MKKSLITAMVMGGSMLISSCSDHDMQVMDEYTWNFSKEFGQIDENQDWNMATRGSVTVNVPENSEVKVYATYNEVNYLFANYKNVSGEQTLTFDVPETVSNILVKANGIPMRCKMGGSVDFLSSATRATHVGTTSGVTVTSSDYHELSLDEILSYNDLLPEGKNNEDRFTHNFVYISNGPFTLYPIFWQTAQTHNVGIYYYDENHQIVKVPVYTSKSGDELQYSEASGLNTLYEYQLYNSNITYKQDGSYTEDEKAQIEALLLKNHNWGNYEKCVLEGNQYTFYKWNSVTAQNSYENWMSQYTLWRSKGITVDIPVGTQFGLYSDTYFTAYSEQELNKDVKEDQGQDFCPRSYVVTSGKFGTTEGEEYFLIGFEDWTGISSDRDFNDMVFRMYGNLPIPDDKDDKAFSWIVAAEDLGSTDDFDFNDIVFSVEHTSGNNTATITLLAAGGTKKAWIYRDGQQIGEEVHEMLKNGHKQGGQIPMINTYAAGPKGESVVIEVPEDFTMSYTGESNIGGFSIRVDHTDNMVEVTAPGLGATPQMFCVPDGWRWPTERTKISAAYPGFGEWGANYLNNTWFNSPVENLVLGNN